MLNRAADARCDVELRRNDFASLTDLQIVRRVARIHRCAACAQRSAEFVSQWRHDFLELLSRAQSAAT